MRLALWIMFTLLVALAVLPKGFPLEYPLASNDPVIVAALEYMAAHQNSDGGFGQFGESDLSTTSRVVEAIAAAGKDPLSYEVKGVGADDYFSSISEEVYQGKHGTNPIADRINLILGLAACRLDPRNFGGLDHVAALFSSQNKSTYSFGTGTSDTAYSILALLAAGVPIQTPELQEARNFLEASQLHDGTFEYSKGFGADSNTHSIVIITLWKMGSCHGCFNHAVRSLPVFQNTTNHGFFYQSMWGDKPDVSSTALGLQAILAANKSPLEPPHGDMDSNPVSVLLNAQNSTTGEFFDPWGSLRPTALAVPALLGKITPGVYVPEIPLYSVCLLVVLFGSIYSRWGE